MAEPASRDDILQALKPLGLVMARPELGGTGLLLNGSLFGVIHGGLVYLKVDKGLREEYHAAGMRPLEPRPKQKLPAFLQVPLEVVEDSQKLLAHAARAAGKPLPKPAPPAKKAEAEAPPASPSTEKPKPKRAPAGERAAKAGAQASKPARTARGKAEKTSS